ncbi:PAS domain-containing protein [Blastococcus sp. KM273128]|uniref:SpoIIE family protein phosphatase n=1 Tax=Blastococcus sp. KM273128 TaxID=2570314 RepID=UPI001F024DA1|nr:SpoIIE family protein phosphatase [Blastococcus sp. KM273128]MCF6745809.1 PAS domain-containing protein [Blastococcus sp. KM273128]
MWNERHSADEYGDPAVLAADDETTRLRAELAIDAAGIGTFDYDLVTGALEWDDRLVSMFGYDLGSFDRTIEAFNARVHPDDLDRVSQTLQAAIDACGDFESLYRICLPSGDTRWISARGRTLCDQQGEPVRFLGAVTDVTSRHAAEQGVARVLETMPAAFFSVDRQWRFTYVNAHAQRLLQAVDGDLVGKNIWEQFPAAIGSPFEVRYRHAMGSGENVVFEAYYPPPLDAWYEVLAWPSPDGLAVYFLDITGRRRQQDRMELLAALTEQLSGTMQAELAVARLARLVVPALADWCVVSLIDDGEQAGHRRGLHDVSSWHRDERLRPLVQEYSTARIPALRDDSFLFRALATSKRVVVESGATKAAQGVLEPGPARDLIGRLAPDALVVLPLVGRDRTVGLLTLFNGADRGRLSDDDLMTGSEVAGRAGLALDNARLYRQQRVVAETLQRSLLTAPPEPDHLEIAVRYLPAAESTAVGGDWYDSFLQAAGATVLVIGDVAGHDISAAASMGQLRGLLRGIATTSDLGPAGILSGLDASMALLDMGALATAVVARLEQTPAERRDGTTRLRWSNAGHLPPLVLDADGAVTELAPDRPELLLGVQHDVARSESVVTLRRGDTVVLFTDGLVERRDSDLDAGLDRIRSELACLAGQPLQELSDQLLEQLVHGRPEDDVALIAVRLHRQDRPRPDEAGPVQLPDVIDDEPAP